MLDFRTMLQFPSNLSIADAAKGLPRDRRGGGPPPSLFLTHVHHSAPPPHNTPGSILEPNDGRGGWNGQKNACLITILLP